MNKFDLKVFEKVVDEAKKLEAAGVDLNELKIGCVDKAYQYKIEHQLKKEK